MRLPCHSGGLNLFQSNLENIISDNQIFLEKKNSRFSIYNSHFWPRDTEYWNLPLGALKVMTTTLDIFVWNGTQFVFVDSNVVNEPYIIEEAMALEASHDDDFATITFENNHDPIGDNDFCQLFLNEETVGDVFGCKQNFTTVEWLDITNDQRLEIVVTALSGARPSALSGSWPDVDSEDLYSLSDIRCVHEHILAYEWDGVAIRKIADVEGCVVQEDLYGVELSDTDNDGQVEILAVNNLFSDSACITTTIFHSCWFEIDPKINIYKWNGAEFVFWEIIQSD